MARGTASVAVEAFQESLKARIPVDFGHPPPFTTLKKGGEYLGLEMSRS